jgi:hypothetical protein
MRTITTENANFNAELLEKYGNKLDHFRTYSYFHVLATCGARNLQAVSRVFENEEQVRKLISTPTPKDAEGNRIAQYANDSKTDDSKFFVLSNGLMDVDIVVDQLVVSTIVANEKVSTGAESLLASAGQIVINEPQGVRFLNIFRKMCHEFNSPASDVRWIIKTIFVGEYDDTGKVGYLLKIPPHFVWVEKFQINVTEKGSVYTAAIINVVNGISYDPALTSSPSGQLIRSDGNVRDALDSLARAYTEDALNNLKRLGVVATNKQHHQCVIELDERINHVGNWTINDMRNARFASRNGSQPMAVPANVSLDGAIAYIFEACAEYLKQAISNDPSSFVYKIFSAMETTPTGVRSVYRIVPYYHNHYVDVCRKAKLSTDAEVVLNQNQKNVIIYDYMFTGRNTDIESLDLHIEEGLGFFQLITEVETVPDKQSVGPAVDAAVVASADVGTPDGMSQKGTIATVASGTNSNQQRSSNQPLTKLKEAYDVAYAKTWNRGAGKMACIIRTRGHSEWLSMFAINPYDAVKKKQNNMLDNMPAVYLNIMMPSATGDQSKLGVPAKYEKFWFQGLWHVTEVNNSFVEGVFTTELSMLVISTESIDSSPITHPVAGTEPTEYKKEPAIQPTAAPSKPFVANSNNGQFTLATVTNATQLTKDFYLGDFTRTSAVPAGQNQPPTQEILDNLVNLAQVLQYIKDQLNIPITINSGYRGPVVNRVVGGASKSDHKTGEAVDFRSSQMSPKQIVDAIIKLKLPYKQLILETPSATKQWVHLAVSRTTSRNSGKTNVYNGSSYLPYSAS